MILVQDEVNKMGYTGEIPAGFVLTGGVAGMPGVVELAREEFQAPVRVAMPDYIGVRDPSYTIGVGLIKYASKHAGNRQADDNGERKGSRSIKSVQRTVVKPKEKDNGMIDKMKIGLANLYNHCMFKTVSRHVRGITKNVRI